MYNPDLEENFNTNETEQINQEQQPQKINRRQQNQQEGDYEQIPINTPLEYLAFKLPRKAFSLVLLALAGLIGAAGLAGISIFLLDQTSQISVLVNITQIVIASLFLLISFLIYSNVIKRGDNVIVREHRGGVLTFDKQNLNKEIFFNKKDPTTKVTVLWNGTAIEKQSGAKVILIKEGSASNENINLCVSETDWAKNLGAMVRAKTFADLAEDELLNTKSIFGLKWQDLALIMIGLLVAITVIILVGVTPDMVASAVKGGLMDGTLQNAVKSIILPIPAGV